MEDSFKHFSLVRNTKPLKPGEDFIYWEDSWNVPKENTEEKNQ